MKRFLVAVTALLLLSACGSPLALQSKRPDDLSFPQLTFTFPDVASQQLDNGMRVYLRENHELPLVDLSLMVEGGSIYDPLDKTGLSDLFAEVLQTGGSVKMTPEAIENELENKAIGLSMSSSSYAYEISLSVHRQDLERALEILADLMKRPRFDGSRLELAKKQMLEGLYRKNDNPGSVARRLLAQSVNPDHPFGRFPTEEEVRGMTRDDLVTLHQTYFTPENVWIAVSGDVTRSEVVRLVDDNFRGWSGAPAFVRDFESLPQESSGRVLLVEKDIPQTTILMGHRGVSKDNPDLMALRVANYILGGGGFNSRMMREVRSNRGLAYSVYSYFQTGRHLPGLYIAGSETKSKSTFEVVSLMRGLMQQLIDEPVGQEELELAKMSLINSFVFAFDDSHSIVSRKMRLDYYGYEEGYLEKYREKVAAVTVADVQRVAQDYLKPDMLQVVLVGNSPAYLDAFSTYDLPAEEVTLDSIQ